MKIIAYISCVQYGVNPSHVLPEEDEAKPIDKYSDDEEVIDDTAIFCLNNSRLVQRKRIKKTKEHMNIIKIIENWLVAYLVSFILV